jgi:hypothetical protein
VRRPRLHAATAHRRCRTLAGAAVAPCCTGGPGTPGVLARAASAAAPPRCATPQSDDAPTTARSPSRSVRCTRMSSAVSQRRVRAAGCPYGLSAPTETSATRAPVAARNAGSASELPWWGTFSTSARRSTPRATIRASASALRSPVSRMRTPRWVTRTSRQRSFGWDCGVAICGGGASTSTVALPMTRRFPGTSVARCTPAARASASTRAIRWSAGGRVPVAITPTRRPCSAPASPVTWSASRCDSINSGMSVMPSLRRQRSSSPGSGPTSTSTACPGAVGTTSASPWPTSHATRSVAAGGQPRSVCRSGHPTTISPTSAASASGRARGNRQSRPTPARSSTVSSAAPHAPAGQAAALSGSSAAPCATVASQRTGQPASHAAASAAAGNSGPSTAASSPRTVAGATAGAARRFAGSDTSDT